MLFFFLLLFCLFCSCQIICGGNCPQVEIWSGNCYCLSGSNGGLDTWSNHETWCDNNFPSKKTGEGHLTSLHSQEEIDFLDSRITAVTRFWVGLTESSFHPDDGCSWSTLTYSDGTSNDFYIPFVCNFAAPKCLSYIKTNHVLKDSNCNVFLKGACRYELWCFDRWAGDPFVCSGNGVCYSDDVCTCNEGYYGDNCAVTTCFSLYSNETAVCSGNGNCSKTDSCVCEGGFSGPNCSIWNGGLCEDSSDRYQEYCYDNLGTGDHYNDAEDKCIAWADSVSSHLVSFHSESEEAWARTNKMFPGDLAWLGISKYPDGDLFPCPPPDFGYIDWTDGSNMSYALSRSDVVCDSDQDLCLAFSYSDSKWIDVDCSSSSMETICKYKIPICFGLYSYEVSSVCNGRGVCVSDDNCSCVDEFFGDDCGEWMCNGISNLDEVFACNGNGICVFHETCVCDYGFVGESCNVSTCFGIAQDHVDSCNGNGDCVGPDSCSCYPGYAGSKCDLIGACNFTGVSENHLYEAYDGWYCYQKTQKMKIDFGEEYCANKWDGGLPNSHLASFHSEGEWDEMKKNVDQSAYIGLIKLESDTNCTSSSKFYYTDGSDPSWIVSNKYLNCSNNQSFSFYVPFEVDNEIRDEYVGSRLVLPVICKRPIPTCFGELSFHFSSVCSGRGICLDTDLCECSNPFEYFGIGCNITTCNGASSDNTIESCSGHGTCWPKDQCTCDEGYFGKWCEITTCDRILSNDSSSCSLNGDCWPRDHCTCSNDYFGDNCNITKCNDVFSNESGVCRSHGTCQFFDYCNCYNSDYYGDDCEYTFCFGIGSDSLYPRVCYGRGTCWPLDQCNCEEDYFNENCNITSCNGIISNDTTSSVCSGKGTCWPKDRCDCISPTVGTFCEGNHPCTSVFEYEKDGFCYRNFLEIGNWNESELVCNEWFYDGHLLSINSTEEENWLSQNINITTPPIFTGAKKISSGELKLYPCPLQGGYSWVGRSEENLNYLSESKGSDVICTKNESCIAMNGTTYFDVDCESFSGISAVCKFEIPVCYGIQANLYLSVCSSHGYCHFNDNCTCVNDFGTYSGDNCNHTYCDGKDSQSSDVCNGHGNCWPYDTCTCDSLYYGEFCTVTLCNGIWSNDTDNICGFHGSCSSYEECTCDENYFGENCNISTCFGVFSNESEVCHLGNGTCSYFQHCDCLVNRYGEECEYTSCNGHLSNDSSIVCSSFGECVKFDVCVCDLSSDFLNGSECQNLFIPSSSFPKILSSYNSLEIQGDINIIELEYCEDIRIRLYGIDSRIEIEWNSTDSQTQNEIDSFISNHEKNITLRKIAGWMNLSIRPFLRNSTRGGNKVIFSDQIFHFRFYRLDDVLESINIDGPDLQYTFFNSPNFELSVNPILSSKCKEGSIGSDAFQSFPIQWNQIGGNSVNISSYPFSNERFYNQSTLEVGKYKAFPFIFNSSLNTLSQNFKFSVVVNSTLGRWKYKEVEIVVQARSLVCYLNESSQTVLINNQSSVKLYFEDPENSQYPESIIWSCFYNYTLENCSSRIFSPENISYPSTGESIYSFIPIYEGIYHIKVYYEKDGRNTSSEIYFNVYDANGKYFPEISITPIPTPIDATKKLVIEGFIEPSEHLNTVSFQWSCPSLGPLIPGENLYSSTNTTLVLILQPNIVVDTYTTFYLVATTDEGVSVTSSIIIRLNYPPSDGSLVITPSSGYVQSTLFEIRFSGFIDTENPMMYRLSYYNVFTEEIVLLIPEWTYDNVISMTFPVQGCGGDNYAVQIIGEIKDYYDAETTISSNSTVAPADYDTILEFVKYVSVSVTGYTNELFSTTELFDESSDDETVLLNSIQKSISKSFELILKAVYYAVKKDCELIVQENSFCISLEECEVIDIPASNPESISQFNLEVLSFFDAIVNISSTFNKSENLKIHNLIDGNIIDSFFEILGVLDISSDFSSNSKMMKFLEDRLMDILYIEKDDFLVNHLLAFTHLNILMNIPKKTIQKFQEFNITSTQIDLNFRFVRDILIVVSKMMYISESVEYFFDNEYYPPIIQQSSSENNNIYNIQFNILKEYSVSFIKNEKMMITEQEVEIKSTNNENHTLANLHLSVQVNELVGKEFIQSNDVLSIIIFSHTPTKMEVYLMNNNLQISDSFFSSFSPLNYIQFKNIRSSSRREGIVIEYLCFEGTGSQKKSCGVVYSGNNDVLCICSGYNTVFEVISNQVSVVEDDEDDTGFPLSMYFVISFSAATVLVLFLLIGLGILYLFSPLFCVCIVSCIIGCCFCLFFSSVFSKRIKEHQKEVRKKRKKRTRIQTVSSTGSVRNLIDGQKKLLYEFLRKDNLGEEEGNNIRNILIPGQIIRPKEEEEGKEEVQLKTNINLKDILEELNNNSNKSELFVDVVSTTTSNTNNNDSDDESCASDISSVTSEDDYISLNDFGTSSSTSSEEEEEEEENGKVVEKEEEREIKNNSSLSTFKEDKSSGGVVISNVENPKVEILFLKKKIDEID